MNLARMMTDRFFIEDRAGTRSGPFKTKFGSGSLMVFQNDLVVAAGDRVVRPLADGSERAYLVESSSFHNGSRHIPSHFAISISEQAVPHGADIPAASTASGGENPSNRDADLKFHGIAASLQLLSRAIERSDSAPGQKREASALLRTLLQHPVVAAVLANAGEP